ncbi:MAG: SpoIIE family protein phosphatase [Treponema sp.]
MEAAKKKIGLSVKFHNSVRMKFVIFTVVLLLSVIVFIAVPISLVVVRPYKDLLAKSLLLQTKRFIDNIELSIYDYFDPVNKTDTNNYENLEFNLLNRVLMDEAEFVVVTGNGHKTDADSIDYVLASSYQDIHNVITTYEYIPGTSRFCPEGIEEILHKLSCINSEAATIVQQYSVTIQGLLDESRNLALQNDARAVKRIAEIDMIIHQLEAKLDTKLNSLADQGFGSYPPYIAHDFSRNAPHYLFYKPIIRYDPDRKEQYVQGVLFTNISIENLLDRIDQQQNRITRLVVTISFVALVFGIFAAWFLSSLFVKPIGMLAAHVAMIRDTEDKEKLVGKSVIIKSNDEFGVLGDTINDMTEKIASAALLSKDLKVGKEVQKMFIPLELGASGRKLTTGSHRDTYSEFFGYYEGAHGVSGDYFDYIKLDSYHYAIIKCDVAGKGVAAALIMVEVATLFQSYFQNWNYKTDGYNLSAIVVRINDVIESHGFVGRFAAFTLCVINMFSGDAYFCNAGDNIIHIYSKREKKLLTHTLPSSSAAGAFSSELINLKGGFPVEKLHLNCGDVLFLYTDGIEESKRAIRTKLEKQRSNHPAEMSMEDTESNSHLIGKGSEELGKDRVAAIIEAVFAHTAFTLKKRQTDVMFEQMDFDFSTCNGTIEDAVMALISIEKVFRMYKDDTAHSFDCVQVDKKIDTFLSKYFLQYDMYCKEKEPHPIYDEYFYYKHIKEDIQYDDLTILGIARRTPV